MKYAYVWLILIYTLNNSFINLLTLLNVSRFYFTPLPSAFRMYSFIPNMYFVSFYTSLKWSPRVLFVSSSILYFSSFFKCLFINSNAIKITSGFQFIFRSSMLIKFLIGNFSFFYVPDECFFVLGFSFLSVKFFIMRNVWNLGSLYVKISSTIFTTANDNVKAANDYSSTFYMKISWTSKFMRVIILLSFLFDWWSSMECIDSIESIESFWFCSWVLLKSWYLKPIFAILTYNVFFLIVLSDTSVEDLFLECFDELYDRWSDSS